MNISNFYNKSKIFGGAALAALVVGSSQLTAGVTEVTVALNGGLSSVTDYTAIAIQVIGYGIYIISAIALIVISVKAFNGKIESSTFITIVMVLIFASVGAFYLLDTAELQVASTQALISAPG